MKLFRKLFAWEANRTGALNYKEIDSACIKETAYQYETKTMFIRMKNETEKQYFDVPPRIYNALLNSNNPDQFFESFISRRYYSL
ncbi:KTSC domain-containing protein [Brevibacillus fluminis]|uniref:KTSC domain-containing protein n=1 Tax=Brevibacillus fluminis TaxID=511487 RepID=UPI003F8C23E0